MTPVHVVTVVTVVRSEVWRILRNMKEKGLRIESITGELSIWRNSVRKYLKTEPKKKQNRKSKLDLYREEIRSLMDDHNLSVVRILVEIRKTGYNGGYTTLKDYCHELRKDRRI